MVTASDHLCAGTDRPCRTRVTKPGPAQVADWSQQLGLRVAAALTMAGHGLASNPASEALECL
jgi:hypothetical protein